MMRSRKTGSCGGEQREKKGKRKKQEKILNYKIGGKNYNFF